MDAIRTVGKHGFFLEEYKGEYSLVAAYEATNGNFYKTWGKAKTGKDSYSDKDRPFKITLGDKKIAVAALRQVLDELGDSPF
jgi:hypothetical protein